MGIYNMGDLRGLPRPVVENLTLSVNSSSSVCAALSDGLFWSFRPKLITQCWFPWSYVAEKANNELLELLCKTLLKQAVQDSSICFGLRDLEEVNVEIFDENSREWMPLPWNKFLDASTCTENEQKSLPIEMGKGAYYIPMNQLFIFRNNYKQALPLTLAYYKDNSAHFKNYKNYPGHSASTISFRDEIC